MCVDIENCFVIYTISWFVLYWSPPDLVSVTIFKQTPSEGKEMLIDNKKKKSEQVEQSMQSLVAASLLVVQEVLGYHYWEV